MSKFRHDNRHHMMYYMMSLNFCGNIGYAYNAEY